MARLIERTHRVSLNLDLSALSLDNPSFGFMLPQRLFSMAPPLFFVIRINSNAAPIQEGGYQGCSYLRLHDDKDLIIRL